MSKKPKLSGKHSRVNAKEIAKVFAQYPETDTISRQKL